MFLTFPKSEQPLAAPAVLGFGEPTTPGSDPRLGRLFLPPNASIRDAMQRLEDSEKKLVLVVDGRGVLVGTVTDGDIRRAFLKNLSPDSTLALAMNADPHVHRRGESRDVAVTLMKRHALREVPVIDDTGRIVGMELLDEQYDTVRRDNLVVLMAGGEGRRLRPLTNSVPKPMLRIGERPLLETIIHNISAQGFVDFRISVNFMSEYIEDYFGDGSEHDVRIGYLQESEPLGTAGSLRLLAERPRSPFIVMNGDVLTNLNFNRLLDFHSESGSAASICVNRYRTTIPYGVVHLEDGLVSGVKEKPSADYFILSGIYVLHPDTLDLLPPDGPYDMPQLIDAVVAQGAKVSAFPISEYWLDVGHMENLAEARRDFPGVFN